MNPSNITVQLEELKALEAIYGDDWTREGTASCSIKIKVHEKEVLLSVTFPPEYPVSSPPVYEISAPWMSKNEKIQLQNKLEEIYLENIGETIVYQWVEKSRETLYGMRKYQKKKPVERVPIADPEKVQCPTITHGQVIVDRRSKFQGHAAVVHSESEVRAVLDTLKQNKKIQHAKHNMFAYRIERVSPRGSVIIQDCCDDDGEAHAGGRMLHLLQILDQKNTLVVVSRWYGGIQLGPDRFRHINNASRQVIEQAGLLQKKSKSK